MASSHAKLRAATSRFLSQLQLNDEEKTQYLDLARFGTYQPGEMFKTVGDPSRVIGMVLSGLFRVFYLTADGDQLTRRFILEGGMLGDLSALMMQVPARVSIEALEASEVAILDYAKIEDLYDRYPAWQRVGRLAAEKHYTTVETREYQFLAFDAKARYKLFREEYPGLENRISQANIASYLGISPVSLSRIRSGK